MHLQANACCTQHDWYGPAKLNRHAAAQAHVDCLDSQHNISKITKIESKYIIKMPAGNEAATS